MVNLHFLSLIEALQECNSTVLSKVRNNICCLLSIIIGYIHWTVGFFNAHLWNTSLPSSRTGSTHVYQEKAMLKHACIKKEKQKIFISSFLPFVYGCTWSSFRRTWKIQKQGKACKVYLIMQKSFIMFIVIKACTGSSRT